MLADLGRQLGADVPVFVRGRSAWAEGIGEQLTPLPLPRRHYVVLDPHAPVSTAELFQAPELTRNAPPATISSFVSGETVDNAFTPVVRARHPAVAAALDWLERSGHARLSGSGGCVFLETEIVRPGAGHRPAMPVGVHRTCRLRRDGFTRCSRRWSDISSWCEWHGRRWMQRQR